MKNGCLFFIVINNPSQPPPTTNSRGAARSGEPDAKRVKEALELHTHKKKRKATHAEFSYAFESGC
jgi:hypothetical protein